MLKQKQITDLLKRLADASEKFAIASLALAAYQGNTEAGMIGLVFFTGCLIMTLAGGAR